MIILPEETRHMNAEWKDVYTCTMVTVIFLINFIVCIAFCGVIQNKVDAIEHFLVSYISSVSHIVGDCFFRALRYQSCRYFIYERES